MLTARKLIQALEALAMPDAPIFAGEEGKSPFLIQGGIQGETARGQHYVLLAPMPLTSQEGGF